MKLAAWIGAGTRVVAWGRPEFLTAAHTELRPHIGSAVVILPPLRDRGGDAIAWAHHLAERRAGSAVAFARDADDAIGAHRWPGNVVQLDAAVSRARSPFASMASAFASSPSSAHLAEAGESLAAMKRA